MKQNVQALVNFYLVAKSWGIGVLNMPLISMNIYTFFLNKKLGSGHSTKSFLTQHEIFFHFSTKSFLIGFLFFECINYQCGR